MSEEKTVRKPHEVKTPSLRKVLEQLREEKIEEIRLVGGTAGLRNLSMRKGADR